MRQTDERKNKHAELTGIETEATSFVIEPVNIEVGSEYAVAVTYDDKKKPIVNIKTYGQVDLAKVRKEILQVFPNARIRQLSQRPCALMAKENKGSGRRRKK